ncbi:MAG: RidA family protein [Alphaproteobacteria bacterium]|nr:RidA family protein [Alphaproteobacteria bacterium]
MRAEGRLAELGIALPPVHTPSANYIQACSSGLLIFLAGNDPIGPDGKLARGVVGADVSVPAARDHAKFTGIQLLAVMKHRLGDLDRVARVVKVFGMVRAVPDFADHETVMDGCSDLFVQVFGAAGRHARTAIGLPGLYSGMTIEIEAVIESR